MPNPNIVTTSAGVFVKPNFGAIAGAGGVFEAQFNQGQFVFDTFTDVAGTALQSHTGELGATWAKHASLATSSMVISDANRARCGVITNQSNLYLASGQAGADVDVSADIRCVTPTGIYCFLCARMAVATLDGYMGGVTAGNSYQIWKYTAGGLASVSAASPKTFAANTTYALKLTVRTVGGNAVVKLYENGVEVCTYTDSTAPVLTAGKSGLWMNNVGISVGNATDFHVDNFTVA